MSESRELYPVDQKRLEEIQSPALRDLIRKEYDPRETIKGFWSRMIDEILKLQEGHIREN